MPSLCVSRPLNPGRSLAHALALMLALGLSASCAAAGGPAHAAKSETSNGPASESAVDFEALGVKPSPAVAAAGAPHRLSSAVAPVATQELPSRAMQLDGPEIYPAAAPRTRGAGTTAAVGGDAKAGDDGVTLNFANTDVRQVIDIVLGETLGLNYTVDPKVKGTITARTVRPLARADVLSTLESMLADNDIAIVQRGGVYKVVPMAETGKGIPSARPISSEMGFGLHILPLRYVSAKEVSALMQPYVPPGRALQTLEGKNVLLFTGTGSEAREIQDLADTFDVDWLRGRTFALLPVTYANADNIAAELAQVFGVKAGGALDGVVGFLPIERLNAVLAMSSEPSYINEAKTWIERLDRQAVGTGRTTYVYRVQNARAQDLAKVLQSLYGGGDNREAAPVAPNDSPTAFFRPSEGLTSATGAAPQLSLPIQSAVSAFETKSGIRIVADDSQNALLVSCNREQYQEIQSVLRQLDTVPLQVLIEATIAEVTLNDELRYGLQWFFRSGQGTSTLSGTEDGVVRTTPSAASLFPGFSYVLDSRNANVVLDALSKITKVRVVSSPTLLVLDNERATLQVGDEVPIATRSAVSLDNANAPIVNQIEFRNTGVILEVTPRVNSSGLVLLDISQEVSDVVATTTSKINSPTVRQRKVASAIVINSGETVALGGLIRDGTTKEDAGVPLLSEIPILGHAFKASDDKRERTELLVLITPRISRDTGETRVLTDELRRRLGSLKPLERRLDRPNATTETGVIGRLKTWDN